MAHDTGAGIRQTASCGDGGGGDGAVQFMPRFHLSLLHAATTRKKVNRWMRRWESERARKISGLIPFSRINENTWPEIVIISLRFELRTKFRRSARVYSVFIIITKRDLIKSAN